ncbi:divalent-cation tolerance protein CutA [Candidatus Micrarchaeota archaeon]|nr:divalent-cation tolerance protein CutA [Candidatus Micrarchaeota archaeon]
MSLITVYVTCASEKEAERISEAVVKERLAACVNAFPVRSFYEWNNTFHTAKEWALLIKTTRKHYAALEARIKKLHSYEVPCIVAWSDVKSEKAYAKWVQDSCKKS